MSRTVKLLIGVPLALAVLAVGGTWTYLNVIKEDAPERLTLDSATTSTTVGASADGATSTTAAPASAASSTSVDGTWVVASGSQAGYRVKEILFGQSAEGVGRTEDVTGQFTFAGTSLTAGSFTVDLTTVTSDESRRDNQFRGRIMDVDTYPEATFKVTAPVEVKSLPAASEQATVTVTGDLTLRGTTKRVQVALNAQRSGEAIRVAGSVPIVFEEWGIPSPSFGPAQVEDEGEIEFLLVFQRSA